MTDKQYVAGIMTALRQNSHARELYFSADKARRREGCLRLGREVGYGLDGEEVISSLYSQLVVQFCMDNTGIVIDNADFVAAVREGRQKHADYVKTKEEV